VASVILMVTLCPETGDDDRGGDDFVSRNRRRSGGEDGCGGKRLPNARCQRRPWPRSWKSLNGAGPN